MDTTVHTIHPLLLDAIVLAKAAILPTMFVVFAGAITLRGLIYYTVRREYTFAVEFERRVNAFLAKDDHNASRSYFVLAKRMLEKTYYQMFEMRAIMKRRRLDYVAPTSCATR